VSGGEAPAETIFALSSGALPAGIAVVRISGPAAAAALRTLAGRVPPPRRATLLPLADGAGELLDRALVLWLPGPGSATGEDLVELHLHGGRATVAAVLAVLERLPGLRPAGPGAFTRRALERGRLDLAEAEGLADLLEAQTEGQRRAALRLAEGGLGRRVTGWQSQLLRLAALVEAALEFAEDHDDVVADPGIGGELAGLAAEMAALLAAPPAERLRDGVRVLIAGPVNAGKSTLLNALAGREVAIALPQEGTTRDLIEAPVVMDGVPMILIDSAGLREADDAAERIGVERARAAQAAADLILWLGSPAETPAGAVIPVATMSDRPDKVTGSAGAALAVSAHNGDGMDRLRERLVRQARAVLPAEDALVLHLRHRRAIGAALAEVRQAGRASDELLVAEHLQAARQALGEVTGMGGVEAMLDALFSRFCVGK
jgi:tRNA modification GTPase